MTRPSHDGRAGTGEPTRVFLRAEWRDLIMANYVIDPAILQAYVPAGTEIDYYKGETFVSLVAFRFLQTKVFGVAFPFHRDFDEVNLRFYVRRPSSTGWRRGVVFLREFVPRPAIAWIARLVYGEPYRAVRMRHAIERTASETSWQYDWRSNGRWQSIAARGEGKPQPLVEGSLAEFITEHYWGYTRRGRGSSEYEVEHPRWRCWPAAGLEVQ